jgi:hypothetical protein
MVIAIKETVGMRSRNEGEVYAAAASVARWETRKRYACNHPIGWGDVAGSSAPAQSKGAPGYASKTLVACALFARPRISLAEVRLKFRVGQPFFRSVTIRSLTQSALAGVAAESERLGVSAARVTRLAGAPAAPETAESVRISPEARRSSENLDSALGANVADAMVDMRVAKYAFMASLTVLKTGAEVEEAAAALVAPKR